MNDLFDNHPRRLTADVIPPRLRKFGDVTKKTSIPLSDGRTVVFTKHNPAAVKTKYERIINTIDYGNERKIIHDAPKSSEGTPDME